jgi:4-amino-4-deoxy-L-arabinose transferase-like glycosyltransferase
MVVALIVFGGLLPLAIAYSLGKLCVRQAPDLIALGVGAVIESLLVFGLLVAGIALWPAFLALSVLGLLPLFFLRPRFRAPLPTGLPGIVIAGYAVFYLIHALAPEIQPDGMSYHLGLVAEYARLGGFPDRAGFFEMLPQGMEMLFLLAFEIGKHSAAKLVHFGFLLATVPLLIELGRRLKLSDRLSGAAAAFYFCAPVVGISGTSTYNDAALVFFTLSTLLALLLWKQEDKNRYLLAAGLLAGFCYAIKLNGILVPALAAAFVASTRRLRPLLTVAAAALLVIAPWMLRNVFVAGNPVAPLGNAIFPTQYFHLPMEKSLVEGWRHYAGFSFPSAPWELTAGSKLQGNFGPVFLLLPIGLLALRQKAGRSIWLAAAVLAIPWLSNVGARFLMPSLPFLALVLAMSLDTLARPALWACLVIHAITCWPAVAAMYQGPDAWRLREAPWRAALRLESEHDYLSREIWEYRLVDLLQEKTSPGETTFALLGIPNAYTDRPIVDWWQSALADRVVDTLKLASFYADAPFYDLRAEWPAELFKGFRFRLTTPHPGEWDLSEIRLYSGADRVHSSPQWQLRGWPNPWEAPVAFDDNFASRWRSWEPMRPGMFVEVLLDRPQLLTSAVLYSHTPVYNVPVEFYGLEVNGNWKLLSAHPARVLRPKEDLRRAAVRYLKRSGISYILAPASTSGVWQLGRILVEQHREWGLEDMGQCGPVHLLRTENRRE